MTDIDALLTDMREGLEGVTPGPWMTESVERYGEERGCAYIVGEEQQGLIGAALSWPTEMDSGDFSRTAANARHIARCSPENLRALLDEIDKLRKENVDFDTIIRSQIASHKSRVAERDAALKQVEVMREALEKIKRSGDEYTTGDGHARCREIAWAVLDALATAQPEKNDAE